MTEKAQLTFDSLPQAVEMLLQKVDHLTGLLETGNASRADADKWMSLKELQEYHPDHPATQTIYGWVSAGLIPNYKKGKKLSFRKSEIDALIQSGRQKTEAEIQRDATDYLNKRRIMR